MPRASWKGFIKLSLVSIPVKGYTAAVSGGGKIAFHQLHAPCHNRIRYQKVCPVHGVVKEDEIVKGYEYAKDQYVVVDPEELERLQPTDKRSINIEAFVDPSAIDPIYFAGKSYYLTPDGPAGQKPYGLLVEAMVQEHLYCVAQVVLTGRTEVMVLRPVEGVLTMSALDYEAQVRPASSFADEVEPREFSAKEFELTKALVEATTTDKFDLSAYKDLYNQQLAELIESKVAGKEVVTAPAEQPRQVINLMDALRASVAEAQGKGKPKARPAPAVADRHPAGGKERKPRKRKTG